MITVGLDEESGQAASRLKAQGYNLSALIRSLLCSYVNEKKGSPEKKIGDGDE